MMQKGNAREFLTKKNFSSTDFKGRYLFIDFWGTWCKGCVQEMPHLKNVYKKSKRDHIEFLGVASMDEPERLARYLKRTSIEWPQVLSDSANDIVAANRLDFFPSNMLVDPNGKIVARNIHGEELENTLRKFGCL